MPFLGGDVSFLEGIYFLSLNRIVDLAREFIAAKTLVGFTNI